MKCLGIAVLLCFVTDYAQATERQQSRPLRRRCRGDDQPPPQRLRIHQPFSSRSHQLRRRRQCRQPRYRCCLGMGKRQHRCFWRRPGQRNRLWPIRGWIEDHDPAGHAEGEGPVPSRHQHEWGSRPQCGSCGGHEALCKCLRQGARGRPEEPRSDTADPDADRPRCPQPCRSLIV